MAIIVTLELCNRIFFFVFRSLSHNNKFNCVKCQMFTDLWSLGLNLSCNYLKKNVLQFHAYSHIHKWLTRYSNTASETHN